MGGRKRKIEIEKIEEKTVKSVAFTKRRTGLFRKASKLCDLSPSTQIAILATPISANSHASFYSFGHPSVDHVVSSLLLNQSPSNQFQNSRLGFWWEDQSFDVSEDVDELKDAVDAVSTMLNKVKLRLDEAVKNTTQRDEGLGFHQKEEQVFVTSNNETSQVPKFEGETSASANNLLKNEEDDLQVDDLLTDLDFDYDQILSCF